MTKPAGHSGGRYLYAFVPRQALADGLPAGVGGAAVYLEPHQDVAAVVSDTALARVRPERRHLTAHHAVIQALMQAGTVLPVAFGTIATSDAALRKMLKRHETALARELQRMSGQVEMGVRVSWDVPNIFQHLVERHPDLKALRDQLQQEGSRACRDEKIELGSCFEHALNEERERYAGRVSRALGACSRELQRKPPRSETEVMNLACLLPRQAMQEFESAIRQIAERLDEHLVLSYNGPWPPHHFINLNLQM